jgi:hypothetical protein
MREEDCVIFVGKRDAEGRVWCQTCARYVATLPRTATERFIGQPPIRLTCPKADIAEPGARLRA